MPRRAANDLDAAPWPDSCSAATFAMLCPDCVTSRVVRDAVFDGTFFSDLLVVTLPLVVLATISALLYRIDIASSQEASP